MDVWMWELDSKQSEHQRIDIFKLWCWRRLLRVSCTTRRSDQSNLKGINPEYLLEGLMLKFKFQHFSHLMRRADLLKKDIDAGRDWGQEEKGATEDEMVGWHHWLSGHEFEQTLGDSEGQRAWPAAVLGVAKSQIQLNDWTANWLIWPSQVAQWWRIRLPSRRHEFDPWVGKIHWRRKWQPIPVFSPGNHMDREVWGGYSPWGCRRVGHNLVTKWQWLIYVPSTSTKRSTLQ